MVPVGSPRPRVLETMRMHGVSADRVDFVDYQPRRDYLAQFRRIDLGLDTFPYNGHTASLDALWMGVPVVTRVGRTAVGRAGLSQLSNLGLTEFVARSDEQFIEIACKWANAPERLSQLRRTLRHRMLESPLTNAMRFARDVETAWREIWKDYCRTGLLRPQGVPIDNRGVAPGDSRTFGSGG
jgi:predicted O-linked N-acetylglucosamine transferase (SPINDLY family)